MEALMNKEVLMMILPIVLLLIEWYMGRTTRTDAGSLIDLVGVLVKKLTK